ncbi:MAG: hypothetical protein WA432_04030 [Candidatus Babeliaceae bacterium]
MIGQVIKKTGIFCDEDTFSAHLTNVTESLKNQKVNQKQLRAFSKSVGILSDKFEKYLISHTVNESKESLIGHLHQTQQFKNFFKDTSIACGLSMGYLLLHKSFTCFCLESDPCFFPFTAISLFQVSLYLEHKYEEIQIEKRMKNYDLDEQNYKTVKNKHSLLKNLKSQLNESEFLWEDGLYKAKYSGRELDKGQLFHDSVYFLLMPEPQQKLANLF